MTTTYWNGNGQYQYKAEEIKAMIPTEGSCSNVKLEAMRVIINFYYNWHQNGLMNDFPIEEFLGNEILMRECPKLAEIVKNDLEAYEIEMEQYWDSDEDEDEPYMIWSEGIEQELELSMNRMIEKF